MLPQARIGYDVLAWDNIFDKVLVCIVGSFDIHMKENVKCS